MAITQAGSTLSGLMAAGGGYTANTGTVSTTITVPADAEIAIVGVSGYQGSVGGFAGATFTKGGVDTAMTKATGGDSSTATWQGAAFYLVSPDTGANKTLKWDWIGTGTSVDGTLNFSITFWKGIDTASPVRDTDGAQASAFPVTTPTLTAQSGDLIVAFCSHFEASGDGSGEVSTWTNLTELSEVTQNNQSEGSWATGSPSGNTTVTAATGTSAEPGLIAIVLKPAGGTAHVGEATFSGFGAFPTSGFGLSPLQPDADSSDGTWTDQAGGSSLFAAIDEMSVDDADYIKSAVNPANDVCKISLGNPTTTPIEPFIVMYRYEKTGVEQMDLGVRLLEGTTEIAAWSHSDISTSFVTAEQTLSGGQFAAIGDFNDLFIEFTADQVVALGDLGLEGDFSGDLTLEGDFSGSLTLEGS